MARAAPLVAAVAAAVCAAGCARAPVRHGPAAALDSTLWRDARRADALGLTPTATLSTGPVAKPDLARSLSEGDAPAEASGKRVPDAEWLAGARSRHQAAIDDAWDESGH